MIFALRRFSVPWVPGTGHARTSVSQRGGGVVRFALSGFSLHWFSSLSCLVSCMLWTLSHSTANCSVSHCGIDGSVCHFRPQCASVPLGPLDLQQFHSDVSTLTFIGRLTCVDLAHLPTATCQGLTQCLAHPTLPPPPPPSHVGGGSCGRGSGSAPKAPEEFFLPFPPSG